MLADMADDTPTDGSGGPDSGLHGPPAVFRRSALVSGVSGVLAGAFLVGFFTRELPDGERAGLSLGLVNDILGIVQFVALIPVAWALGRLLAATRAVQVATAAGMVAMGAFAVLSGLLVAGVLTFAQQIGPVIVAIVAIYGWLLAVNLIGHRTRALPRVVTRTGLVMGLGLPVGLMLAAAGTTVPGPVGVVARSLGYGLAGAAWLGLPAYVLVLAARVFRPTRKRSATRADSDLRHRVIR